MEISEFDDTLSSPNREHKALSLTHDINQLPIGRWGTVTIKLHGQYTETVRLVADGGNVLAVQIDPPVLQLQPDRPQSIQVRVQRGSLLAIPAGGKANVTLTASTLDGVAQDKKDIPVWVRRRYEGLLIALLVMLCPVAVILSILAARGVTLPPTLSPMAAAVVPSSTLTNTPSPTVTPLNTLTPTLTNTPTFTPVPPTITPSFTPTVPTAVPCADKACQCALDGGTWHQVRAGDWWGWLYQLDNPVGNPIVDAALVYNGKQPGDYSLREGEYICLIGVPDIPGQQIIEPRLMVLDVQVDGDTQVCQQAFTVHVWVKNIGGDYPGGTIAVLDVPQVPDNSGTIRSFNLPVPPLDANEEQDVSGQISSDVHYGQTHEVRVELGGAVKSDWYTLQQGNCGQAIPNNTIPQNPPPPPPVLPQPSVEYAPPVVNACSFMLVNRISENVTSYSWSYEVRRFRYSLWGLPLGIRTLRTGTSDQKDLDANIARYSSEWGAEYFLHVSLTISGPGGTKSSAWDFTGSTDICYPIVSAQ